MEDDDNCHHHVHPLPFEDLRIFVPNFNRNRAASPTSPEVAFQEENTNKYFSVAMGIPQQKPGRRRSRISVCRRRWQQAALKARNMTDPWERFHLEEYPVEKALRFRYNTFSKEWVRDDVLVKMDPQSFAHGAMRECFRLKKMSSFSNSNTWKATCNYVAKRYMEPVDRQTYMEDVRLQMDAKLWGEEYNRHNPPKKVDIMQVSVLEFIERENSPVYHLEHFIEGIYIKYNSNSGYVVNEQDRQTPQAFSHFTFERSGHELLVVDIQGVGDLYTDPQIHTANGKDYNDGNLGTRGMALFFHSHVCNSICESLGLFKFDLATSESMLLTKPNKARDLQRMISDTCVRGTEELCISPAEHGDWHEIMRQRSGSVSSAESQSRSRNLSTNSQFSEADSSNSDSGFVARSRRSRYISESGSLTNENEMMAFQEMVTRKSRPSNVHFEVEYRKTLDVNTKTGGSILGEIHLQLAKYHEVCRFSVLGEDSYDQEAAMFHLRHAANCGDLEAIICLARIHLQLPHNVLVDLTLPATENNLNLGVDYLMTAAEAGDRASMLQLSAALDTGIGLGTERKRDWIESIYWSNRAINMTDNDESDQFDGCLESPNYQLLARQAEMYREGGFNLKKDPNYAAELFETAAEQATAAAKGRLASKYYALAEETWGLIEE